MDTWAQYQITKIFFVFQQEPRKDDAVVLLQDATFGFYWGYIRVILGLSGDYMGVMWVAVKIIVPFWVPIILLFCHRTLRGDLPGYGFFRLGGRMFRLALDFKEYLGTHYRTQKEVWYKTESFRPKDGVSKLP